MNPKFIAGTASPRRLKLLDALGIKYTVLVTNTDEVLYRDNPVKTVIENALAKHKICHEQHPDAWILAADTIVEFQGRCICKPVSHQDAYNMLASFSGAAQTVLTGVVLSKPDSGNFPSVRVCASSVTFKTLTPTLINEYLEIAKPYDRAGAYDIDAFGEMILAGDCGSCSNTMGLPTEILCDWLLANGYPL